MRKFRPGDKVIIKSKSYFTPLRLSSIYFESKEKGYAYFIDYSDSEKSRDCISVCIVDNDKNSHGGDYFLETDLELYESINKLTDEDFMV